MLKGIDLFNEVFKEEIEANGYLDLYEIEEVDGISCFNRQIISHDGWYNFYTTTFRYMGKKYSFEYKRHITACDIEYNMNSFQEVVESGYMMNAINKIIKQIESKSYNTLEDVVEDLENLKGLIK